jgi:hypothetical protein
MLRFGRVDDGKIEFKAAPGGRKADVARGPAWLSLFRVVEHFGATGWSRVSRSSPSFELNVAA